MIRKYLPFSAKVAVLVTALTWVGHFCSATAASSSTSQPLFENAPSQGQFQPVGFRDSAEAEMLRRAYRILAHGDHDYKGHRVKAMHSVEAAAKLLGLELRGEGRGHEKQAVSDEQMREAQGLIQKVLLHAEVKSQTRIVKHLNEANEHIAAALAIR